MDKVIVLLALVFLLLEKTYGSDPVYISGNFSTDSEFNRFWEGYNGEPNIIRLDIEKKNDGWNCCILTSPLDNDTVQWQYNCPLSNFSILLHSFRDLRISCSNAVTIGYMMFATQAKLNKTGEVETKYAPTYKNTDIKYPRNDRLIELVVLFSLIILANILSHLSVCIGKNIYRGCKNNKKLPEILENYKKQNSIV